MNSFGVVFDEMNKHGLQVDVARKNKDGVLQSARPEELATLCTKSRVAAAAKLLQNLDATEKLQWAIDTKEEGNVLFQEQKYSEAMEKYVEALSASDFGSSTDNNEVTGCSEAVDVAHGSAVGNIDILIIPVLCNLSACSIQLKLWYKAAQFADHALRLRPTCRKAALRRGIALYHITEFQEALLAFRCASEEGGIMPLTEEDGKRLRHFKRLVLEGLKREKEAIQNQKLRLQEVLGGGVKSIESMDAIVGVNSAIVAIEKPMGIMEALWTMILFLFQELRKRLGTIIFGFNHKAKEG
jgi:tetratricopeptide (TPR) repeat protein